MYYHIVCDPVHGIMKFDTATKDIIKPIIDTKYFQRLRHIKQLSFTEYAYPGAVHTRFNHCIGAAYLAQCVASVLEFNQEDRINAVVTALVHDIGHGPFSHSFETLYGDDKKIKHELWNAKFIQAIIDNQDNEDLKKHLEKAKYILDTDESKITDHADKLLKQIVSSQLDVDRFDYLLRDSHFSGVSYGHFDVQWLISCMRKNDGKIVVEPKGMRAVEHYLMARRLMNLNVYFHKKSCSAGYLLRVLFRLCEENINELKNLTSSPFLGFIHMVKDNKNNTEFEKIMLKSGFDLYTKLTDYSVWNLISQMSEFNNPEIKEISTRFLERNLPITLEVKAGKSNYVKQEIDELRKSSNQDWRIYYDKPELSFYKTKAEEIFVNESNGEHSGRDELKPYTNALNYSSVLNLFSDKNESFDFVYLVDNDSADADLNQMRKLILELGEKNCLKLSQDIEKRIKSKILN